MFCPCGTKLRVQRPGPTAILGTENTSGDYSRTGWPDESLCRTRSPPGGSGVCPLVLTAAAGTTRIEHRCRAVPSANAATLLSGHSAAGFGKSTLRFRFLHENSLTRWNGDVRNRDGIIQGRLPPLPIFGVTFVRCGDPSLESWLEFLQGRVRGSGEEGETSLYLLEHPSFSLVCPVILPVSAPCVSRNLSTLFPFRWRLAAETLLAF